MQNATKKSKDEVQEEAKKVLSLYNNTGLIAMATGTGKSKIAVDKIAEIEALKPELKALVVVPTEKLRDENWKNEFVKWGKEELWAKVRRSCYASVSKISQETFDIVILDECHNITLKNSEFFQNNTVKAVIGLTATPPTDELKVNLLKQIGLNIIYQVSLDQAVSWGLISPYKITVVKVSLDSSRRNIKLGKRFLTELEAYHHYTSYINHVNMENGTAAQLEKRKIFIGKRRDLIYNLESKFQAAKFILDKMIPQTDRTLIFAGSKKQAEQICPYFFHSSSTSEHYNMFKAKLINRLAAVNALNEGDNIEELDNALIIQSNSRDLHLIQRIGRIVRYREGHLADIFILVARNTVDEEWFESASLSFENQRIESVNFSLLLMNA